jgi:hypothetical protein
MSNNQDSSSYGYDTSGGYARKHADVNIFFYERNCLLEAFNNQRSNSYQYDTSGGYARKHADVNFFF